LSDEGIEAFGTMVRTIPKINHSRDTNNMTLSLSYPYLKTAERGFSTPSANMTSRFPIRKINGVE